MRREELEMYLNEYLHCADFDDDSLNGLQVEGSERIETVALAVSACAEAFRQAAALGAQALLVHHGLLWKRRGPEPVRGSFRTRLDLLLRQELNLLAYHLPLDAHAEVGNNAVALRELGFTHLQPFGEYRGRKIGWQGELPQPQEREEFRLRIEQYYGHRALFVAGGPAVIRSAGLVSGGAPWEARQAAREQLDCYLTGEAAEPVTYLCREEGINFAALGHYATERIGVRALGEHLERQLGLKTAFVELDNEA